MTYLHSDSTENLIIKIFESAGNFTAINWQEIKLEKNG